MKFILTIFLIYLAFRLITYVALRIVAYKLKKSGMSGNETSEENPSKNKKKIFKKEEGDYVDFEEVDKK